MSFSVIIVHYRSPDLLKKCLESIPQTDAIVETTVVDNGSEGDLAGMIRMVKPNTVLIRPGSNIGFGSAVNLAADAAVGEHLLILNQDIQLSDDTIMALSDSLKGYPAIGIWGIGLRDPDGKIQGSSGPFPTLTNWVGRLFKKATARKYYSDVPLEGAPVDWVTGAAMLVKKSVFNEISGFDPAYFMYYEDVDLCKRAHGIGIPVAVSRAHAVHSHPLARRKNADIRLLKSIRQGQLRYFLKHRPYWEFLVLLAVIRTYYLLKGWKWKATYL